MADPHDPAPPAPAQVRSFDVFDTLIARRCIEPHRVFDSVAEVVSRSTFAAERIAAEAAIFGGPYTLADIYSRLSSDIGLEAALADQFMSAEMEAELAQVIPIAENIAQVRDGDLLISDMYLPEHFIRQLVERAGLTKNVGLIVTAHGKRSGEIWPKIAEKFAIEEHMGDNVHADVTMARAAGLKARHTTAHAPSHVEQWLLGLGLTDLASVLREARLRTWSDDPVQRRLQVVQIQLNLPILILSSIRLARLAQGMGAERILFASRDCNMWLPLFDEMAGQLGVTAQASYFYTSRQARLNGSQDYMSYAADLMSKPCIVADVCGTGWSMSNLFETLGVSGHYLFFTHWMKVTQAYVDRAPLHSNCTVDAVINPDRQGVSNLHLEMCNYAEHGSVRDVRIVNGAALPVFDIDRRSGPLMAAIAEQRRAFAAGIEALRGNPLKQTLSLNNEVITELVAQLYQLLSQDTMLPAVYFEAHMAEDGVFMETIRQQSQQR